MTHLNTRAPQDPALLLAVDLLGAALDHDDQAALDLFHEIMIIYPGRFGDLLAGYCDTALTHLYDDGPPWPPAPFNLLLALTPTPTAQQLWATDLLAARAASPFLHPHTDPYDDLLTIPTPTRRDTYALAVVDLVAEIITAPTDPCPDTDCAVQIAAAVDPRALVTVSTTLTDAMNTYRFEGQPPAPVLCRHHRTYWATTGGQPGPL